MRGNKFLRARLQNRICRSRWVMVVMLNGPSPANLIFKFATNKCGKRVHHGSKRCRDSNSRRLGPKSPPQKRPDQCILPKENPFVSFRSFWKELRLGKVFLHNKKKKKKRHSWKTFLSEKSQKWRKANFDSSSSICKDKMLLLYDDDDAMQLEWREVLQW